MNRNKFILFIALFNSVIGFSSLFPILPPLAREFGFRESEAGWLLASYGIAQLFFSPVWGKLSERWGRKKVLLIGTAGFFLNFLLVGLLFKAGLDKRIVGSNLFVLLFLARFLGGLFSSATFPTAQAYMADISKPEERASSMAFIGAAIGLGLITGPAMGFLFATISPIAPIWVSAALSVCNMIMVWIFLEESSPSTKNILNRTLFEVLRANKSGLFTLLASNLGVVALLEVLAFVYQDRMHLSRDETVSKVGMAFMSYGIVAVLTQGILVKRARDKKWRITNSGMLLLGLAISFVSYIGVFCSTQEWQLLTTFSCLGMGQAFIMPAIMSILSLSVGDDEQGAVAGLASSAQSLGRVIGPIGSTWFYELNHAFPFMVCIALSLLALISSFSIKARFN